MARLCLMASDVIGNIPKTVGKAKKVNEFLIWQCIFENHLSSFAVIFTIHLKYCSKGYFCLQTV